MTNHLSEEMIQQYVLDAAIYDADAVSHIHGCELCRSKAEAYQMLFAGIEQQPKPVFDFDLQELVMQQIPQAEPEVSPQRMPVFLLPVFIMATACIAAYFYRTNIIFYYKKYVLGISTGVSKSVLYLLTTAALAILIFQSIELYKKYQRKIDDLNFY
ncbi:MAG TPA: hypothetical protein VMT76_10925 [Puia sp.]|nr:hypothetical protein [Puia sp.]